jgi:putative transposase
LAASTVSYLKAENTILKARGEGRGRLRFTDSQRCLLAAKAKELGRAALKKLGSLVTPDTLLRWHRKLIARKCDGSTKRGLGRPSIMKEIEALILRMATENPTRGYLRITGAVAVLGHAVARMIFFSEAQLRRVVAEYVAHYHEERPHQGVGNVLLSRAKPAAH